MKKLLFSILFCLCFIFTSIAQTDESTQQVDPALTNKRGIYLLPEHSDFALGIDVTPFLDYLGGFLSTNGTKAPIIDQTTIYGKYFLEDERAIRVRLDLFMQNTAYKNAVPNDFEIANNPLHIHASVIDIEHITNFGVDLGVGFEFRRGHGRVQGFYGGEVGFGFLHGKQKYDWANPMTEINQVPSSSASYWNAGTNGERVIEYNPGKTFSVGLGGFVGVEYFFAPKISLGGELSLTFKLKMTGQSEVTTETWNSSVSKVERRTIRPQYDEWLAREISVSTAPVAGGRLFVMFYF